ncbi:hypothetical protein GCM10010430_76070 [Kitasatospora cystarginea]|uniref:Methyl-accepting transducer domain-containing protein n=1 Tax=Kitasatospora cystarginea TaxID=58350 RepID=A0ABN3F069_9ACTN
MTKPFGDGIFGDDYNTFLNSPGYGQAMRNFLLDDGKRNWAGPAVAKPSQATLDRALAILKDRQDKADNSWHWYGANGVIITADLLKGMSAYQIARFIRFGGYPTVAPAKDSVEFRMEVEDLKTQWAGCDGSDPLDPTHVLDDVVATASAEWQAEQAAQADQRAAIVAADIQAYQDVRTASDALVEASGQAYIVSRMLFFQKFWQGQPKSNIFYPKPDQFTKATAAMADAKKVIAAQLAIAQKAAASAKTQADSASAAESDAGKIAGGNGTPYGRGLTYAQQSAQVTKASAAAAQSASKAIETTLNAVSAGQADSKALYALGDTQTHATQAEFQRAAAQEAADQAHNAAAAAAAQADQAGQAAARAKADKDKAQQAEQTAKAAAADAAAKRVVAEQERANAAAARQQADAQRAAAQAAEAKAQQQQAAAQAASNTAQTAEQAASDKSNAARDAEAQAAVLRDAAVDAEQHRDAALSRQKALEAAAQAAQGTTDATETRQAADAAKAAAGQATDAAAGARTAADHAGQSAIDARTSATQATGAAQRSRAAADAVQADAATSSAAAATAHAAAADAIAASEQAAQNVKNADAQAHVAAANAVAARKAATIGQIEADHAAADSARATGQAFASAQAASAARDAANAAIDAGNSAVALGTPFRETDSSAGLAVLVGQDSKTIAQQQADAAKARADEAARAAKAAQAAADKAQADAKAAAQLAANAAADTVAAFQSVARARDFAAQAASDAAATRTAETNTTQYDMQANSDALTSALAANGAQNDAMAARAAATDAEKDAATARTAATTAEGNAATARSSAATADQQATAAEQAAANAQSSAQQADQAAQRAEDQERKDQQAALAAMVTSPPTPVADLTTDETTSLSGDCGADCVEQYNQAQKLAGEDVIDWVKENGGQILLDVLGVTDAKKCFASFDIESCLWTAVNVASFIEIAGKIPAVSRAIVRITEGISKFLEEVRGAKATLQRLRQMMDAAKAGECLIDAASAAAVPAGAAAFSAGGAGARHASAMAPRAKKSKFCGIKWVAVLHDDFCAKGMHINLKNGAEVSLFTIADEIVGKVGRPAKRDATDAEIKATIEEIKANKGYQSDILRVGADAIKQFNTPGKKKGTWGADWSCGTNRAVEIQLLLDAVRKL